MPITTFLNESELNQPSGYGELDDLLNEVRAKTGDNWQIVNTRTIDKRLFARDRVIEDIRLYVYVGGAGPWQWISVAHCPKTIRAYLLGLLSGLNKVRVSDICN